MIVRVEYQLLLSTQKGIPLARSMGYPHNDGSARRHGGQRSLFSPDYRLRVENTTLFMDDAPPKR